MPTWHTKDGKCIEVTEMTDSHLRNARTHMNNRLSDLFDEQCAAYGYPGQGDMATYYAEQAASEIDEIISDTRYWIRVFDDEITRRKNAADQRVR